MQKTWLKNKYLTLILSLALTVIVKFWLIVTKSVPFNSDEAIVSLMARHIIQGSRPAFFYGQAYMGSLDAWLVAGGFMLFGEGITAIRIVQSALYLGFIVTLWFFARKIYDNKQVANYAVVLAAVPPVLVTTYSTATLGGYGESLLLGNLILLLGYEVTLGNKRSNRATWLLLGLVGGLAFWVLGIAGVYLVTVGIIGLSKFSIKNVTNYLIAASGFFVGSAVWWLYNFNNSWEALQALSGPESVGTTIIDRMVSMLLLGIPALLGMRMPWSPEFFPLPIIFIGLLLYLAVLLVKLRIGIMAKLGSIHANGNLLRVFIVSFVGILVLSRYGLDATGRYLLPLYLVILLYLAELATVLAKKKRMLGWVFVAFVMLINGTGTLIAANSQDKITTQFDPITSFDNSYDQALMDFLIANNEMVGYTNYWVSFRIAFLSDEKIIYSPQLPYKPDLSYTTKDDRYKQYSIIADESEQVAYITTKHEQLNKILRAKFIELGVSFDEQQIGEFHIFYNLSRAVRPEELGYGEAYQ